MTRINTNKKLIKKLGIKNIKDLEKPEIQDKFFELCKDKQVSTTLLKRLINQIPILVEAFNNLINNMSEIGKSLHETQQVRWKVLREISKTGELSGEEILEAMKIIEKIEKNENVDWERVFVETAKAAGRIALAITIYIATKGKVKPKF